MLTYYTTKILRLDLQLFAEGGSGDAGAEGTGVFGSDAAAEEGVSDSEFIDDEAEEDVHDPDAQNEDGTDPDEEFEKLVKGKYKKQFGDRVQGILQERFKNNRDLSGRLEAVDPILEAMAERYGIDKSDPAALLEAFFNDESMLEKEAFERGISVDRLREDKKADREKKALSKRVAQYEQQEQERKTREEAQKLYRGWEEEAKALKKIVPSFDLQSALADKQFVNYLRASGGNIKGAYMATHSEEFLSAAMTAAAKSAEKKAADRVRANASRPTENGLKGQAAVQSRKDVSQLTVSAGQETER